MPKRILSSVWTGYQCVCDQACPQCTSSLDPGKSLLIPWPRRKRRQSAARSQGQGGAQPWAHQERTTRERKDKLPVGEYEVRMENIKKTKAMETELVHLRKTKAAIWGLVADEEKGGSRLPSNVSNRPSIVCIYSEALAALFRRLCQHSRHPGGPYVRVTPRLCPACVPPQSRLHPVLFISLRCVVCLQGTGVWGVVGAPVCFEGGVLLPPSSLESSCCDASTRADA